MIAGKGFGPLSRRRYSMTKMLPPLKEVHIRISFGVITIELTFGR